MQAKRIKVKMCGMTRAEDIAYAASLGVDAIGMIFYQQSPRALTVAKAKQLCAQLPAFLSVVAVVVNPDKALVEELIRELPINLLQFHGEESESFCTQFNFPYIKSIAVHSKNQISEAMQEYSSAAAILLDTPSEQLKGGTGKQFDWQMIDTSLPKPYILAGGLNAENVHEALQQTRPYAVDVSSGIEQSPGVKDHNKMSQFIKAMEGKL